MARYTSQRTLGIGHGLARTEFGGTGDNDQAVFMNPRSVELVAVEGLFQAMLASLDPSLQRGEVVGKSPSVQLSRVLGGL